MQLDRITQDRLFQRVAELYSTGELDHDLPDLSALYDRYESVVSEVRSKLGVLERREWSSYGQGLATFLESWFYRPEEIYEAKKYDSEGYSYKGVSIVFSLLEPMFVAYQSEKRWSDDGDSGVLPSLSSVGEFESEEVNNLSRDICSIIRRLEIPQASRRTLGAEIDPSVSIDSNLSDDTLKLFDAFFHWMD